MEVTINYNGQAVAVEVTLEVYEFLDRADHKAENLSHEQRHGLYEGDHGDAEADHGWPEPNDVLHFHDHSGLRADPVHEQYDPSGCDDADVLHDRRDGWRKSDPGSVDPDLRPDGCALHAGGKLPCRTGVWEHGMDRCEAGVYPGCAVGCGGYPGACSDRYPAGICAFLKMLSNPIKS